MSSKARFFVAAVSLLVYTIKMGYVYLLVPYILAWLPASQWPASADLDNIGTLELLFGMVWTVGVEEAAFRYMPLAIILAFDFRRDAVIIGALWSSVVFGFLHGFTLGGVLVQGFGGLTYFVLAYSVLKYFIRDKKKWGAETEGLQTAFVATFCVHYAFNMSVIAYNPI